MQADIDDGSFRDIRNTALITWFIMVGGAHNTGWPPLLQADHSLFLSVRAS